MLDLVLSLCVLQMIFRLYDQIKKKNIFFSTPLRGGWGKNFKLKNCPKFSFLIFRKSQEVSIQEEKLLRSIRNISTLIDPILTKLFR